MDNLYTPDCIRTYSGLYVNVFELTPEMIDIRDIAHGLSLVCRFAGHTKKMYTVAEHSLLCSHSVNEEHALAALLHDASEAYLGDLPSPIKNRLPDYRKLEDGVMKVIAEKFRFEYPLHPDVKRADKAMLEVEWESVVLNNDWPEYRSSKIEIKFLRRYMELTLTNTPYLLKMEASNG